MKKTTYDEHLLMLGIILYFCANHWSGQVLGALFWAFWFIAPLLYKNKLLKKEK